MFKTRKDVSSLYKGSNQYKRWFDGEITEHGSFHVAVYKTDKGYDVWNIHPLRKGWQLVYTLEKCCPEQQVKESIASLKRLFEE